MPPRNNTILTVDDDADCRRIIRDAILMAHPESDVREAASGFEALEYLRNAGGDRAVPRPAVVYLDIELPGMSGQALLKTIKADPAMGDIPVVMLTSLDDDEQARQAAAGGANSYLVKPTDPYELVKAVWVMTNYWLTMHRQAIAS